MPILPPERNPLMLDPVPDLELHEPSHRYRWRGEWLAHNVSDVLNVDMTPFKRAMIDKYRDGPDGWAARGTAIHKALELHLLDEPQIVDDKWSPWLDPLLDDPFFKGVETLATEYRVMDRYKSLGGSFDFLIRLKEEGLEPNKQLVILGDLKSVSSKKAIAARKPATAQLGAYTQLLSTVQPSITVGMCVTVVSGPEKCKVIKQDPEECLAAWQSCWDRFSVEQPDF